MQGEIQRGTEGRTAGITSDSFSPDPKTFAGMVWADKRLAIATELLRGHAVGLAEDGYDPGGFQQRKRQNVCMGALEMAEMLMQYNESFDGSNRGR